MKEIENNLKNGDVLKLKRWRKNILSIKKGCVRCKQEEKKYNARHELGKGKKIMEHGKSFYEKKRYKMKKKGK